MLDRAVPLLLVGAGKMGGAMLEGWLDKGIDPAGVTVLDPNLADEAQGDYARRGVGCVTSAEKAGEGYRIIVLAVKPQLMGDVLPRIAPLASEGTLVISVAAGVRQATIAASFGPGAKVVRIMPNTPAQIGQGMSVAVEDAALGDEDRALVEALLGAVGDVAWVPDEAMIDAVTAVSGSGPAYVFLLAEAMAEAGRTAGLPAELAERLARRTVSGGGGLLAASPLPAATLRENVTSPNGTTAAALSVLMAEDGLQPLMDRAIAAAKRRSEELG